MSTGSKARKNVSKACQSCRTRKIKCSGDEPCEACVRMGVECVYPPGSDGRSLRIHKRKYEEMQRDQEILDRLLIKIQKSEDAEVRQIVSLIRSQAPLEDIKTCVQQQILDDRISGREVSPELVSFQGEIDQVAAEVTALDRKADHPDLLSIHRLTHAPLCRVPALPWTTVTDDDELVSHLISTWLVHDKNWYDWVHEDFFLEAMGKADLNTKFCSPFLVNNLLAWACPYSDWTEARSQRGSYSALATKFADEGKRLLEEEIAAGSSLTLAQGLLFLWFVMSAGGEDRLGYYYMTQSLSVMQDLVSSRSLQSTAGKPADKDFSAALDYMAWGIYNCATACCVSLMKPQLVTPPNRAKPVIASGKRAQRSPYEPLLAIDKELLLVACDIAPIVAKITQVLFGNNLDGEMHREKSQSAVLQLHSDFRARISTIPNHLTLTPDSLPSIYAHHLWYEAITLRLMMTLKGSAETFSSTTSISIQNACVDAAVRVARACKWYMTNHNELQINIVTIQPCLLASLVLLEELPKNASYASHIVDVITFMRRLSRRWPLTMAYLRMVQMNAKAQAIALPSDVDKLFENFEQQEWKERAKKKFISILPDPSTNLSKGSGVGQEIGDMGSFLEQMEELDLSGEQIKDMS